MAPAAKSLFFGCFRADGQADEPEIQPGEDGPAVLWVTSDLSVLYGGQSRQCTKIFGRNVDGAKFSALVGDSDHRRVLKAMTRVLLNGTTQTLKHVEVENQVIASVVLLLFAPDPLHRCVIAMMGGQVPELQAYVSTPRAPFVACASSSSAFSGSNITQVQSPRGSEALLLASPDSPGRPRVRQTLSSSVSDPRSSSNGAQFSSVEEEVQSCASGRPQAMHSANQVAGAGPCNAAEHARASDPLDSSEGELPGSANAAAQSGAEHARAGDPRDSSELSGSANAGPYNATEHARAGDPQAKSLANGPGSASHAVSSGAAAEAAEESAALELPGMCSSSLEEVEVAMQAVLEDPVQGLRGRQFMTPLRAQEMDDHPGAVPDGAPYAPPCASSSSLPQAVSSSLSFNLSSDEGLGLTESWAQTNVTWEGMYYTCINCSPPSLPKSPGSADWARSMAFLGRNRMAMGRKQLLDDVWTLVLAHQEGADVGLLRLQIAGSRCCLNNGEIQHIQFRGTMVYMSAGVLNLEGENLLHLENDHGNVYTFTRGDGGRGLGQALSSRLSSRALLD